MYSVAIKVDGIESKRRSTGLLHIVIGFFLIAKGADYYQRVLQYESFAPALPFFVVAVVSLVYGILRKKLDLTARYNQLVRWVQVVTFLVLGLLVMNVSQPIEFIPLFLFAVVSFLLLLSEKRIFSPTVVRLEKEGVVIPGTYREHVVPWEALSEVVVREDFLTIFHVKKKYLQYQVVQDLSTLETAKMNGFCKEQIEKAVKTEARNA